MKALYKNYFRKEEEYNPVLKALQNVPIFNNLSKKELTEVKKLTHERMYKTEEPIFKKMAPSEGMYVIVTGNVNILDPDTGTSFTSLRDNDFFGELALLDEEPRSASAIAKSPSKLIGFFRTDLLTLMKRYPELGNKILLNLSRILGERLRKTNEELLINPNK
jgi:CRP-like cAMP-binding protein